MKFLRAFVSLIPAVGLWILMVQAVFATSPTGSNPNGDTPIIRGNMTVAEGADFKLTADNGAGGSYSWQVPDDWEKSSDGGSITSFQHGDENEELYAHAETAGTFQLTVTDANGVVSKTYTVTIKQPTLNLSFNSPPPQELLSPKYRKIALNGLPLSDEKPQATEESDETKEETYIDALDLSLNHSTTDIYIPFGKSDLNLTVRRNASPLVWDYKSYSSPQEQLTSPFGIGWSTNLGAHVKLESDATIGSGSYSYQRYVYVVDQTGTSTRFLMVPGDGADWVPANADPGSGDPLDMPIPGSVKFIPFPSGGHESQSYYSSLTLMQDSEGDYLLFRQRFGTTLKFRFAQSRTKVETSGKRGGGVGSRAVTSESYYRLTDIQDRYSNTLHYEFPTQPASDPKTLIPSKITFNGTVSVEITTVNGLIQQIKDPRGNIYTYQYAMQPVPGMPAAANIPVLTGVLQPQVQAASGGALASHQPQTLYSYDVAQESDTTPIPLWSFSLGGARISLPHYHCNLSGVTDPQGNTYTFHYRIDNKRKHYAFVFDSGHPEDNFNGYYPLNGMPRFIYQVDLPGGGKVTIQNDTDLEMTYYADSNGTLAPAAAGHRIITVTDASHAKRRYTYTGTALFEVREWKIETVQFGVHNEKPRFLGYNQMKIEYLSSQGAVLGSETFKYDPSITLAPTSAVDFSGNETKFQYHDSILPSATDSPLKVTSTGVGSNVPLAPYYPDPNQQTNALNGVKTFSYESTFRLLKEVVDEKSRKTDYSFDPLGNRLSETIYDGSTKVKETLYEYLANSCFMTKKTLSSLPGEAGPGSMVTTYLPDAVGNIASETVDPGGLNLTTGHTYDANNNKLSTTDPLNHTTSFTYDALNRLTQVTYPSVTVIQALGASPTSVAGTKQIAYTLRGKKAWEVDENGVATLFEYDPLSRLTRQARDMNGNKQIDGPDLTTAFTYNAVNSKLTQTDANGNTTSYVYDDLQRLIQNTSPAPTPGGAPYVQTFEYGANSGGSVFNVSSFKPTKTTDPRGYVTEVTYDGLYRPTLTKAQYALSPAAYAQTTTEYDAVGNATATIDALGIRNETVYDALNQPVRTNFAINAPGPSYGNVQNFYTSTGLKWKTMNEKGLVTQTVYDLAGRPVQVISPAINQAGAATSAITQTVYDNAGNAVATVNPLGKQWDFVFDARNRKIEEDQPAVVDATSGSATPVRPTIFTAYDPVGHVAKVTDARGNATESDYDLAGRLVLVKSPAVPVPGGGAARPQTVSTYDNNGNVLTLTDANAHTTTNVYDALNRLITSTDAKGITVASEYDAAGDKTAVIDGKSQRTEFTYDGLKRNLTVKDPANKVQTFSYNALYKTGRVDPKGQQTNYSYDARGRLTLVDYNSTATAINSDRTYVYDLAGNLLSVSEPGKSGKADVVYSYDELNRVIMETSGGLTHGYTYDLAGNHLKTVYGGTNRTIVSSYDALNRLSAMTEGGAVTSYAYDLNGNIAKLTLPNGDLTNKTYDALNRDSLIQTMTGGSASLSLYAQTYDLVGNVVNVAESYATGGLTNRTIANSYDQINRLTQESITTGGTTVTTVYEFDAAHNRTKKTAGSVVTDYTYNNLNQLTQAQSGAAITTFGYDDNGNQITKFGTAPALWWRSYDFENRLIEARRGNYPQQPFEVESYIYDYRTRRVERNEFLGGTNTKTKLVFSGGTSVQEYTVGTTTTLNVEYVRGSDYGGGVGGILYTIRSGIPSYTHYNNRGDVVAKTNASGALTYEAQYEAYGKRTAEQGSTLDRQKANTKDEDPTGLLNEGFRYRDLETGTFITRDPLGFVDGPNMYAYVVQNPWTKFDPEGLQEALTPFEENGIRNFKAYAEDIIEEPGLLPGQIKSLEEKGEKVAAAVKNAAEKFNKNAKAANDKIIARHEEKEAAKANPSGKSAKDTKTEAKPIDASRPQHGTESHDATAYNDALEKQNTPGNSDARFNQQLTDTNGNPLPGFRPDSQVTRTLPDGSKVKDVTEVQSPSQPDTYMNDKIAAMKKALGGEGGDVKWIPPKEGSTRKKK